MVLILQHLVRVLLNLKLTIVANLYLRACIGYSIYLMKFRQALVNFTSTAFE
jgi:hypothetical protein